MRTLVNYDRKKFYKIVRWTNLELSKILIHDLNEIYSYLHFLPFADNEQFPGKFFSIISPFLPCLRPMLLHFCTLVIYMWGKQVGVFVPGKP
jgi:hypothetical protein